MSSKIQFLAYYLPQYHPIPENDTWWGKGFTEWTNVKKAKPLFKGHNQPIKPGEFGYYDLLQTERIQEKQAQLAIEYGIDGFIYYQYYFGENKMLLEKPAEKMLANKNVAIPFCFCWANESWKGTWHGLDNPGVLIEQIYDGAEGYIKYFNYLLPFFNDERYIKVDNKPMFHVYRLEDIPDLDIFIEVFNKMAVESGFEGIYLISTLGNKTTYLDNPKIYGKVGLDAFHYIRYSKQLFLESKSIFFKIIYRITDLICGEDGIIVKVRKPFIYDYEKGVSQLNFELPNRKYIYCVFPNWDNSARSGMKSLIFKNSNPLSWKKHFQKAVDALMKNNENPSYIFIKSWNEWAEGNYLEPDEKYGRDWLEVVKEIKSNLN